MSKGRWLKVRHAIRLASEIKSAEESAECGNKLAHLTEEAATITAIKAEHATRQKFDAYLCKFCGHWHIGHG